MQVKRQDVAGIDLSDGSAPLLTRISHRVSSRGRRGAVPSGVFDQEAWSGPPVPSADGSRESRSRREEEVDARASSTTSNAEIGHDPHRPEGLRRRFAACVSPPPARVRWARLEASPRPPCAVVGGLSAAWPRLLRCLSSAMEGHRRRRGALNPEPWRTQRTTLGARAEPRGRGARTCGTSSTPMGANAADSCRFTAAAEGW